ncbi:CSLREA domain-containing protein [Acinetobacter pragensis]
MSLMAADSKTIYVNTFDDEAGENSSKCSLREAIIAAQKNRHSLVIAGQQKSYVLTQGGPQFVSLIGKLDPKNIQITRELSFYSEKNDGHFTGILPLSYVKLKEDISKKDLEFFIENGAKECSNSSDERMLAQRFCFEIKLAGVVYPAANNLASLKALSKPYQVSIYTQQEESYTSKSGMNPFEKLVLLPFAVAIDVVSLPFQAADKIFD